MVTIDQGGAQAPRLRVLPPDALVAPFVEMAWIDDAVERGASAMRWRVVADDAPHVIYALSESRRGRSARLSVVGARNTFADIDRSRRIFTVGVRLRPGALRALFGVPADETTEHSIPVADLVPRQSRSLALHLDDETPELALMRIDAIVRRLVLGAGALDRRAAWIARHDWTAERDVDAIGNAFGITTRGLRTWARGALGLSVKRFLRIRRVHRAVHTAIAHPTLTWARIAARAGFADQAHCIREFHDLLGETPTAFLARGNSSPRVPIRSRPRGR